MLAYPFDFLRYVGGEGASILHRDGLNSVRVISDAAGLRAKRTIYLPFGEAMDYNVDPAVAAETKGFIGERYDADAGLQYLNARYYDPELARFIQPDWFEVTAAGSNRYSYSYNDPINASDPSGNIPDNWSVPGYETAYDSSGWDNYYDSNTGGNYGFYDSRNDSQTGWAANDAQGTHTNGVYAPDYGVDPYFSAGHSDAGRSISAPSTTVSSSPYAITSRERSLQADGNVAGFWVARAVQHDPIAKIGLSSLFPQNTLGDFLFGGHRINGRLDSYSRFYLGKPADAAFMSTVRTRLMDAHIDATDLDTENVAGLLNPGQIYDYHAKVFNGLGLPAVTFGGTPIAGMRWETNLTRGIWCSSCDK